MTTQYQDQGQTSMDLHSQVEQINSREDLIAFIRSLRSDLQASPASWENDNLLSYLDAVASWIEDMDGYYAAQQERIPTEPTWQTFGQVLLAAKYYE